MADDAADCNLVKVRRFSMSSKVKTLQKGRTTYLYMTVHRYQSYAVACDAFEAT